MVASATAAQRRPEPRRALHPPQPRSRALQHTCCHAVPCPALPPLPPLQARVKAELTQVIDNTEEALRQRSARTLELNQRGEGAPAPGWLRSARDACACWRVVGAGLDALLNLTALPSSWRPSPPPASPRLLQRRWRRAW